MRKLTFLLMCLLTLGTGVVNAQSKTISGKVISAEDGEPIIGATVRVVGTSIGAPTNDNGNFTIQVPETGSTLHFTYMGMKAVDAAAQNGMVVKMEADRLQIEEVVVTAMGISKSKKSLGYATQDLKSEELTRAASTNVASALQGKVSGVEIQPSSGMPGASSKITIRGSRSFTGDNTPLYVVDGMPISSTSDISTLNSVTGTDYANRAIDIDPNDIESINVLKGQAASALYGMRATNGVILITTKSGKGARSSKPEITFNTNYSSDVISVLPEFQSTYAQGTGGKYDPTSSFSWGPTISELPNDAEIIEDGEVTTDGYGGNTDNAYTRAYGLHPGQYYVPQRARAGLDPWATPQTYNNVKDFFQTGYTWSNSLNVAQSLDKGHYSFSLGNTTSDGIIPTTGMDRYNAKLNAELKLNPSFTTGFTGNFSITNIAKQSSANDGIVATVYGAPASYDLAGIPSYYEGAPYKQNTYRGTGGFDGAYWSLDNNSFTEKSQRFFGNAYLKYNTDFGTDNQKLDVKYQLGDDSYITNYKDIWGYGHSNGLGSAEEYAYTVNEFNSLLTAAYTWKINEDFDFDALVGNEFVQKNTNYNYTYGGNFNFGGWNHMSNASVYSSNSSARSQRSVGNFANASVAYKNMLYLSATGRNDIVSQMPRNNRSFFYPSVSLGYIFTEMDALKNDVLNYGKIRLSYAEVGQAGNYYDTYYTTPTYGGGFSSGTPIMYPLGSIVAYTPYNYVYDPNLKPQNTKTYEIGTDLNFLNGLVSLSYTYSRQNVKDQIFDVPLAGSTGSSYMITNGGSIHTNTHEVTLGFNPINTKNVKWDFGFNFSKIDNFVDKLAEGVNSIFLGGFVEPQVRAGIGYKFPVIYGVSYLRNDAGQIVVDADGFPQAGEEKVIGTVSPDFTLGFNTSLQLYKARLSAVIDWKQGGQMYSGTSGLLDYYGRSQRSADLRSSESFIFPLAAVKEVTDASGNVTYEKNDIEIAGSDAQSYYTTLNDISESMIFDNSFVKLREIALSYPVYAKSGLNVNLSVFARNILLWSEFKDLDPECSQGNTNMAGAFERFSLPGTSSYGFGLNIKF